MMMMMMTKKRKGDEVEEEKEEEQEKDDKNILITGIIIGFDHFLVRMSEMTEIHTPERLNRKSQKSED